MDPRGFVRSVGGFATTAELRSSGHSEQALTRAVRDGSLIRVRRGCYSTLPTGDPRVTAVRVGGRLTGLSAIEALGGWVWERPTRLQVAVSPNASRLRAVPGVQVRWMSDDEGGGDVAVVSVASALVRTALDEPVDSSVAAFDWAFRAGAITWFDFEAILLRLPESARCIRDWVDPRSQSILESVARCHVRQRGWAVRSQARVGDLGSIDLVIEDHVALELDGQEFHESTFEADRRKDLQITIEGRHSLRISASILRHHWVEVELAIAAALRARRRGDAGNSAPPALVPRGSRRHPAAVHHNS